MILMQPRTLHTLLAHSLKTYPANPAIGWVGKKPVTYTEFGDQIFRLQNTLKAAGVRKGDRVALLAENMPNWPVCYFAVTTMGAVAVPVMYDFSAVEIDYILRHAKVKVLFVSSKYLSKVENDDYPSLTKIFNMDELTELSVKKENGFLETLAEEGKKSLEKIRDAVFGSQEQESDYIPSEDDISSLIYTSGTTGHSKGVVLTHKNIVANVLATVEMSGIKQTDTLLSILPLSHTFECTLGMITPVYSGACIYYLNGMPVPAVLLPALQEVKPTIMMSVPLIMEKIYRNKILPAFKKSAILRTLHKAPFMRKVLHKKAGQKLMETFGGRMRLFCIGGAPLAEDAEQFLHEGKFPYSVGYGLTETSPLVTGNPSETYKPRTVGRPIPGVQVSILDKDPSTHIGEIAVKGDNVMPGYYEDEAKTSAVFTSDGWFRTGDLGFIDSEGYIHIKGRSKNMILGANGKNIYPEEIEALINEQEYVLESLVYEQEGKIMARVHFDYKALDELFTPLKLSVVEAAAEIKKKLEAIKSEINSKIPSYAQLSAFIEQTDPFEKTPTLKIKRYLYQ
ncbi:MAG: AMP-binding protein [Ignavibacteriales bacterium]|nr:MAG: AMP-binding protein [Ignavibacteriales bacterium]